MITVAPPTPAIPEALGQKVSLTVPAPTGYLASLVLCVVDAIDGALIIWWVRLAPLAHMNSRLCGAWTLAETETEDLSNVIARRIGVPTAAGQEALTRLGLAFDVTLDLPATQAAVHQAHAGLIAAFKMQIAARPANRPLVTPTWPALPPLIVMDRPVEPGQELMVNTLAIARDFDRLITVWDALESIRISHRNLHGGLVSTSVTAQTLPYVLVGS